MWLTTAAAVNDVTAPCAHWTQQLPPIRRKLSAGVLGALPASWYGINQRRLALLRCATARQ
jgi:hypothetical protein